MCLAQGAPDSGSSPAPLHVQSWAPELLPPVFGLTDSLARRGFAPDSIRRERRQGLGVAWTADLPAIDGRLDDWTWARWKSVAGRGALLRGGGTEANLRLDYALRWTAHGIAFAAWRRDVPLAGHTTSVVLAFASDVPYVQRVWVGPSRLIRVRASGAIEAWTDFRGRRAERFDASPFGARAVVAADSTGAPAFELFVPWEMLFPALPGDASGLLCNVVAEDSAGGRETQAAAYLAPGTQRSGWARLDWEGGPPVGTWICAAGTREPEGWLEWSVVRWAAPGAERLRVVQRGPGASRAEHDATVAGPAALVRLRLEDARSARPADRAVRFELESPRGTLRDTLAVRLAPPAGSIESLRDAALERLAHRSSDRFPASADFVVRFERAVAECARIGTWFERRYHATGVLAWRAGAWRATEAWLADAAALERLPEAGREARSGVPLDRVVLRGLLSDLDASVQPYALYVPAGAAGGPPAPLVVALHGFGARETTPFETTRLAAACAARGWIAVSPYGRGDTGFELAGERDVLDVVARVRTDLRVDGRRIFVLGAGMGGTGTWLLSLRHPELFAAAAPVSAYGDLDQQELFAVLGWDPAERAAFESRNPARLVRPGLRTAYRIAHGERDPLVSVVHARILAAALQEAGVPHELVLEPSERSGDALLDAELELALDFFAAHPRAADGVANPDAFAGTGGPVAQFFARGPFLLVYGTRPGGDAATDSLTGRPHRGPDVDPLVAQQIALEWAARFAGTARALPDTALTEELARAANLVLVGDAQSNRWLARWRDRLPVAETSAGFTLRGRTLRWSDFGILFAAPNPEFPGRSVLVVSGMLDRLVAPGKSYLELGTDWAIVGSRPDARTLGDFDSPAR